MSKDGSEIICKIRENGMVFEEVPFTQLLDSMALITGGMNGPEKHAFEMKIIELSRTIYKAIFADAETRAVAAVLALGLEAKS